jgi:transcriptional regulator with XRE-family HTH domain
MNQTEKQDEYIFIQNLIMIREAKGLYQWQMVEALGNGLKMKRYQSWEERRGFPPPFFMRIICEKFNVEMSEMLTKRFRLEELREAA